MNATNRVLNRTLLLLVGCVLSVAGASMVLWAVHPPWAKSIVDTAARWLETGVAYASRWVVEIPGAGTIPGAVLTVLGAMLVLLVLLVMFLVTRGGGTTSTVLQVSTGLGSTAVDRNVADAMLADRLLDRPDVLSARISVHRVKRAPAIKLTVTTRQGAHVPRVLRAVEHVVAEWDALAGTETPVVLHLEGRRWRGGWRSATRVR